MVFCQILDDNKLILKPKKKLRNIFIFVVCRLCETFEEMLHVAPLWSVRLRSLSGPIKKVMFGHICSSQAAWRVVIKIYSLVPNYAYLAPMLDKRKEKHHL